MKTHHHIVFSDIRYYLSCGKYPLHLHEKGLKANFRKSAKKYLLENDILYVTKKNAKVKVIEEENERREIVKAVHEGLGESIEAKGISSHYGRDSCIRKIAERFYWHGIRTGKQVKIYNNV